MELCNAFVNLIEASGNPCVSVDPLGLTGISQVVDEIGIEWFPLCIICAFLGLADVEQGINLWEVVVCFCNFHRS